MSINFKNNSSSVNIVILDLFPSYSELNPSNEEIMLIFEGLSCFFDLKDLLASHKKIEIDNYNQYIIKVSLIKSNNIMASGNINIKYGEQWVTLNSENKRRSNINLALSLIDCIKLKIFCEMNSINKSGISTNNSNFNNNSLNLTNINNYINLTNRNTNKNKKKINQMNIKISKKNTNNKLRLKGSPGKNNLDIYATKRSPKNITSDYNNIKYSTNDYINNNILKNNYSNFNSINHQNSIKKNNNNPYSTLNYQSIKKIDLNSSSKTRNTKIDRKSPINYNYTSLRTSNICGIKKMNTSAFNLNLINKNKNFRLTPDIEIKELHNSKNTGGSPKLYHKNKLDEDFYHGSGNKTFHFGKKSIINNNLEKNDINKLVNNVDNNKIKKKKNNYSNNILNINYENNNNIINMNIVNNINNNQYRNINNNNYCNFNNTFGNNFNKQDIKNKLLYPSKQNSLFENQPINYIIDNNLNNNKKTEFERSLNSLEGEEEKIIINKTKENIRIPEKISIYTNKRVNIKKKQTQMNKKYKEKNINSENILMRKIYNNSDYKEKNELNNCKQMINKEESFEKKEMSKHKEKENYNDKDNNEMNFYENDNFERLREDFLLLYNDDYMNNIQEDLIKLELELFFEKMAELIQSYHNEYNLKNMEKELIKNNYKFNIIKYKSIQKAIKKLEISKIDNEIKNMNKKYKPNDDDLIINKTEIGLLKNMINKTNICKEQNLLKDIFYRIINNKNIKALINSGKFKMFPNNNIIKEFPFFNSDITNNKQ